MMVCDRTVFGYTKIWNNEEISSENTSHKDIEKIEYHQPSGEGDAHYVDVFQTDGVVRRIFRPDEVIFQQEAK